MFTAIVLDEDSQARLRENLAGRSLEGFNTGPYCHHVTINMGTIDSNLNPESLLGTKYNLLVVSIAYDNQVVAFGVDHIDSVMGTMGNLIRSVNKMPHITAGVKNGGKPYLSNKLQDWGGIIPISVSGILEECE